jgi:glycosyltransferase involved in cell wall biosynthesis
MASVSVILPTYNRAVQLRRALASVLRQTYNDYEIIIIDDGSTDDTQAVVAAFNSSVPILYSYQANRGRSAARNAGIKMAQGTLVAFLDSDDLFLPDKLKLQTELMNQNNHYGFTYTDSFGFSEEMHTLLAQNPFVMPIREGWIYPNLLRLSGTVITTPTVMARTSVLRDLGGFDEAMDTCEDLDLWRRIAKHYPVGYLPEKLSLISYRASFDLSGRVRDGIRSRRLYYAKAFADDPKLKPSFYSSLMAEMYTHYGIATARSGQISDAVKLLVNAGLTAPVFTFAYLLSKMMNWLYAKVAKLIRSGRIKPDVAGSLTSTELASFLNS